MEHKKETQRAAAALKEAQAKLKHTKREQKKTEAVVAAMFAAIGYTIYQLGHGKRTEASRSIKRTGSTYWTGFAP